MNKKYISIAVSTMLLGAVVAHFAFEKHKDQDKLITSPLEIISTFGEMNISKKNENAFYKELQELQHAQDHKNDNFDPDKISQEEINELERLDNLIVQNSNKSGDDLSLIIDDIFDGFNPESILLTLNDEQLDKAINSELAQIAKLKKKFNSSPNIAKVINKPLPIAKKVQHRITLKKIKKVLPRYVRGNRLVVRECTIPYNIYSKMNIHEIHELTFEGCFKKVYRDHLGNKTIGIGHLLTRADKRRGLRRLTTPQAIKLFKKDRRKHSSLMYRKFPWVKNQPKKVQEFMKSFAFNIGVGKPAYKDKRGRWHRATGVHQFKRMLENIKKGCYKSAASGLSRSRYSKQVQKSRSRYYLKLLRTA